ncbi:hypothetical protein Btru_005214 [Bulinus truncatus]|nr:hypothetical protein Btru_005214 [Bulinus truncatus]
MVVMLMFSLCFWNSYVNCLTNLKDFETFSEIDVTTRIKRSHGDSAIIKNVRFTVFDRDFHLILQSGTTVLTSDFSAYIVEGGRKNSYRVDQSKLYTGSIKDKPLTFVNAYVVDGLWSINILDDNDTFSVEPAKQLLQPTANPNNDKFVAYRMSDLKNEAGKCGFRVPNNLNVSQSSSSHLYVNSDDTVRMARDIKEHVCVICAIGDYDVYEKRCGRNHVICFSMLINFVQFTDLLFRASNFLNSKDAVVKLGVQVGMLFLYTTPTLKKEDQKYPHFNEPNIPWDATIKLDSIAYHMSFQKKVFCHIHVFTSYPMPEHVLGYAYLSGLCLIPEPEMSLLSTGFSSTEDITAGQVSSLQLNLVFAHGHCLGSYHDPNTLECAPSDSSGGKYLMWERSVLGNHHNHKLFSPCSLKAIGREIESKGTCLVDRSELKSFCGNGIVEEGEQCDAGADGLSGYNPCCSQDCQLHNRSVCSDTNDECCEDCRVAPNNSACLISVVSDCKKDSYCKYPFIVRPHLKNIRGNSLVCPAPESMVDWSKCTNDGACIKGVCKGFCEIKSLETNLSLKACMCHDQNACRRCCFNNSDPEIPGPCVNHTAGFVPDGQPCYLGFCEKGVCKTYQSKVRTIYSYITSLKMSELVMFMRTNIVLTVIILATVVWVPSAMIVTHFDKIERDELDAILEEIFTGEPDYDMASPGLGKSEFSRESFDIFGTGTAGSPRATSPATKQFSFSRKLRFADELEDISENVDNLAE